MGKEIKKVPGFKYVKSSDGIHEYQLISNGLSVLVREDHSAPVAAFMVVYRVGSRNEAVGYTGATHLLEHLMFKGSKKFNQKNGKSIDVIMDACGAINNASTSFDRTNYYALFPSQSLEDIVAIEADRMRNAFLTAKDLKSEMPIVHNEFERDENEPFDGLRKQLWAVSYQAHPYHHPVIGWRSDIEHVSIERLQEFYNTFYWPNNASAIVVGDIDTEQALGIIKKHFNKVPSSSHAIPETYTQEPEQEGPRRSVIRRFGQKPIIGIAHKIPSASHPDTYPLQVLAHIVGAGKSSRLFRLLVDKGLATEIYVSDNPLRDPGLLQTYVWLTPGTSLDDVESIVLAEFTSVSERGVSTEEVKKAQEAINAAIAFSRDGAYAVTEALGESVAVGDWTFYTTLKSRIAEVVPEDVQRVAQKYLIDRASTTVHFIPQNT